MKLYDPHKHGDWQFVSVKRDGFCVRIQDGKVLTRKGIDIADKIGELFPSLQGDLVGELYVPGHPSSEVPRAIASYDVNRLRFELFHMKCNQHLLGSLEWDFCKMNVVKTPSLKEDLFLERLPEDCEGYIIQEKVWPESLDHMVKWKPIYTADCKVVGVQDGRGKYIGCIGALICEGVTNDGHHFKVNVSSGLIDEDRYLPDDWFIGRMIEIRYQYIAAGGRPRHPVFVRLREDLL